MRLSEIPTAEAEAIIKSWVAYHGPIGPEACIPDPPPAYIRGFFFLLASNAEIELRIARKEKKELLAILLGKKKGQKNVPKH